MKEVNIFYLFSMVILIMMIMDYLFNGCFLLLAIVSLTIS